jgi:hypothetical protein
MAITSYFYDGSVSESPWSLAGIRVGRSLYGVLGINDLKVTIAAGDRTVSVGTGGCWGKGVYDVNGSAVSKTLATVSSGTRYDLIVVRRNWSTNTTSIEVVTGTSTRGIPSRSIGYGTLDEQPIALVEVRASSTLIHSITDLRCWAGSGGGLIARDDLAKQYLNETGTRLFIGLNEWIYAVDGTGGNTTVRHGYQQDRLAPTGGSASWTIDGDILVESFGTGKKVIISIRVTRKGPTFTLNSGSHVVIGTIAPAAARGGNNTANFIPCSVVGPGQPARSASLMYGNGDGILRIKQVDVATTISNTASFAFDHTYYIPGV